MSTKLNRVVVEELFGLIADGPEYSSYFFNTANNPEWLLPIKEKGYLAPDKAPGPKKAKEKGYLWFPQWEVLPYLETVSKQIGAPGHEENITELLNVIKQVTNYHVKHKKKLDNYRTWWYFVKILINIPNEAIPQSIIDLLPVWLDSKFDNSLPGSDIARKLFPKFLNSTEHQDFRKAEKIIESITAVKCKKKPKHMRKGFLRNEQEAETVVDSYWLVESFKLNSKKVGEKCSENVLFYIADRLKQVFRCEKPDHELHFKVEEKEFIIYVEQTEDFAYRCEVHLVLYEKEKDRSLEEKIINGVELETQKIHKFTIHDCQDKDTFIENIMEQIRQSPKIKKIDSGLEEKLGSFYEGILSDYSYIWLPSIISGPELSIHRAKETLAILLRDVLQAKANADPAGARKVVGALGSSHYQYPLFKRMVIFTIAQKWDTFADEFDIMLKEDNAAELFDNPYYEYEVSQLLSKHISKLTEKQKRRIKDIIETGPKMWVPDQQQKQYIERWKQKWYNVIKSDTLFAKLHKKQVKITGVKEELSTKPVYSETRVGPGPSPLTRDELVAIPNEELVTILASFETKDRWKGPTVGGLAEALSAAAESDPNKFVADIMSFINTRFNYIYYLLFGLRMAWSQKKPLDWEKLLQFLWKYTDRDDFWNDQLMVKDDERNANHQWITGMIGELIQEGTRDDAWAFSENLLPQAKQLLFLVLDREKSEELRGDDFLTDALNSVHGKMISALMLLALRVARIEDKKGLSRDERWAPDIKARYNALLATGVVEAYTFLGNYMPNLYYLDAAWMNDKIDLMSKEPDKDLWGAFMEGYLLGARLYTDLYELMKPNYERALTRFSADNHITRRLVEHIAWRYLDGVENLQDPGSLFHKLLKRWDTSQIVNAIRFFWGQRDHLAKTKSGILVKKLPPEFDQRRQRIIEFWAWIYRDRFKSKVAAHLTDGERRILGSLSKLTVFLREIDSEKAEWLMASVPGARMHVGFDAPFFLEYLDDLKDADAETTRYVGKILRKLADTSAPDFKQEHIHSIVEHLYSTGDPNNTVNANDICNIYGSKGLHFLRGLWEKHNP